MVSSHTMMRVFLVLLSLSICATAFAEPTGSLTAQQWSRPRHGEALVDMPGLNATVHSYLQQPNAQIVIHHPIEEEGLFWAEELKGWLTSLGIASSAIQLVPAPVSSGVIELYIE